MADLAVTGAGRLVEALERLGVDLVFGLPGVHNLPLWRALSQSAIRLVGVRHEQTAVYAADGYARTTGRLGVALVTSGPGAANTLGATGEAMAAGSPVLVIATDVSSVLRRPGVYRGLLHETRDQTAMFAPVTKAARLADSARELASVVLQCAQLALQPSSGPVYLGVPTDLLREAAAPGGDPSAPAPAPEPDAAALARALELLAGAERPLIWAGGGALRADAGAAVGALARTLAAPVVTTYMGRGLLAPEHPCAVPGPIHARELGSLWDEADVVLAIGTDFDAMMTQEWRLPVPPALIAVTIDPADANKNYAADVTLTGDARAVTETLVARAAERGGLAALAERLHALGGA
ncbi:MAG TPA: thiamine pyrophosphate-binding protein, partial [Solirubrobacteraceae bacterium]